MSAVELVVARWQEDLSWLRNVPASLRLSVYDKSEEAPRPEAVSLPNIGREAHTYLHHLVERSDSLAEWTVFCQGKPFDHAPDFHAVLRRLAAGSYPEKLFQWLGFLIDTDDRRGRRLFVRWSKNAEGRELDGEGFHQAVFGTPSPEAYLFHGGAQFIVHRELVWKRPRAFYENARAVSRDFPDAAHCFERVWDRFFGVEGVDPVLMNGQPTRYLKPIRRLMEG
jgi:hypothetical protein